MVVVVGAGGGDNLRLPVAVQIHDGGIVHGGGCQAGERGDVVSRSPVDDAHVRLVAVDNFHGTVLVEVEGGHGGGAGEVAGALQPHLL